MFLLNEPRLEISNNVVYATSKGSDQPVHMHSLIRAFSSSNEYSMTVLKATDQIPFRVSKRERWLHKLI